MTTALFRNSIATTAVVAGVGLHSGAATRVRFLPTKAGHGIRFRRIDLEEPAQIELTPDDAGTQNHRHTSLGTGERVIRTVEHLLAAVAALQIDDLVVEVDGPEPPAGDGSAAPYFDALRDAGIAPASGTPTRYAVRAPFALREGAATYLVGPGKGLSLTVTIKWPHPLIGRQSGRFEITPDEFARSLARARTFGFIDELDALQAQGLAGGASTETTIALSETDVVGTDLRWPDEFVRHKATDLLGDLALLGGRLEAEIVAFRPSHTGNVAVARAIHRGTGATEGPPEMSIQDILGILPHRYPMLLVDRILEIEGHQRIVGLKNVTINEPFFQGHFPGHPIMPGVLIVEAMAQVGGLLLMGAVDEPEGKVVYFMSIDNVKFRRPVVPGDQLILELEMIKFRGKTCQMRGVARVNSQVVAEADMTARVVDR